MAALKSCQIILISMSSCCQHLNCLFFTQVEIFLAPHKRNDLQLKSEHLGYHGERLDLIQIYRYSRPPLTPQ